MPRRTDTILHDIISEGTGGSAYHHFQLSLVESAAAIDTDWERAWIAPRAVRIINNRMVATIIIGGAAINTLDVFRNIGAGTNRTVITQFDPDTLVADTLNTPTLSTADSDNLPNVVANQYQFFVMVLAAAAASTGPFNMSYMAHYSFEDI